MHCSIGSEDHAMEGLCPTPRLKSYSLLKNKHFNLINAK